MPGQVGKDLPSFSEKRLITLLVLIIVFCFGLVLVEVWGATTVRAQETTALKTFTNSIGMKFVLIPAGQFLMGSPPDEVGRQGDETQHKVTISKPFYLQTTEVTQKQWRAVMGGESPHHFRSCGDDCPAEYISWEMIQGYIVQLNSMDKAGTYRLPTEAEWEYACRAGTQTPYWTGYCLSSDQANYDGNYPPPNCRKGKYTGKTVPVAGFDPNPWGLYDMHGNVWEWCQDWFGKYPEGEVEDYTGPETGTYRVLRGGGWGSIAAFGRSAIRLATSQRDRCRYVGFRLVLEVKDGD